MRLLNTSTLQVEEFFGSYIPGYAILSHRWEMEEVTLRDLRKGQARGMAGYSKVANCCKQAATDGWKWAWIDSCCIDKTSSSELSETINSMFKWYSDAKVCYVYLSDVSSTSLNYARVGLRDSKWFTRGWTLQELLAPVTVIFFDALWVDIGTKESLKSELSTITGIRVQDFTKFKDVCVARKMSWASRRETTRVEDRSYCLMGLFGINMPTLYGEGNNAFLRLQLEILSSTDDESIFAWATPKKSDGESLKKSKTTSHNPSEETILVRKGEAQRGEMGGLLAGSPSDFVDCGDARLAPIPGVPYLERPPYSMTNKGIRMEHLLIPFPADVNETTPKSLLTQQPVVPVERARIPEHQFLSLLHCRFEEKGGNVAIPIFQGWGSQPAERITDRLYHVQGKKELTKRTLYIRQHQHHSPGSTRSISDHADIIVSVKSPQHEGFTITDFLASWFPGILMSRPTGGYKLSDIPSPAKGSKATIGFVSTKLKFEFVVFLVWSTGPRAQVEPKDPLVHIDLMAPKLGPDASSDRLSKTLPNGVIVSVCISPGSDDGADIYRINININTNGFNPWMAPTPDLIPKEPNVASFFEVRKRIFMGNGKP
jgi:hypothetical protein